MIVQYDNNGNIVSYAIVGGFIPDPVPDGENYLDWDGVTPEPPQDYQVVNDTVVLKSQTARQAIVDAQAARAVRGERDRLLARADGVSLKYQEQVALSGTTPDLSTEQYQILLQYKQDLRDIPEQSGFPNNVTYPTWPF